MHSKKYRIVQLFIFLISILIFFVHAQAKEVILDCVDVKEINPTTMESKLVKNVYFAGEVLDVDAVTGGFNLQVAWSSAYAAAMHLNN
jgi:predicted flavoprotein YhiN